MNWHNRTIGKEELQRHMRIDARENEAGRLGKKGSTCSANQLTGFYRMETLAFNQLSESKQIC